MCSHQTGENAMNILKINKDVSPMWKNKKYWHNEPGLAPGQGHLSHCLGWQKF